MGKSFHVMTMDCSSWNIQFPLIVLISLHFRSTESGWDNPFRPGGDLSREADEIVNLIKGDSSIPNPQFYVNHLLIAIASCGIL